VSLGEIDGSPSSSSGGTLMDIGRCVLRGGGSFGGTIFEALAMARATCLCVTAEALAGLRTCSSFERVGYGSTL